MPANRNRLHLSQLDAFASFAATLGWTREPVKGEYEVLRLTKSKHHPCIYLARTGREHATVPLNPRDANWLVNAFLRRKRDH